MTNDVDVLVVGAGPVGLTAAVELAHRGVRVRVIDRLAAAPQYAKAVGIQPRTVELWERTGLLGNALDEAVPMRGQVMYVDGEQVGRIDLALPPDVPYGFLALPQYTTERLLTEQLRRTGVEVRRPVELLDLDQDVDGVTARLGAPGGEERIRASYLVGADGAHSCVRKGLRLDFGGGAFGEEYMLGDIELDWDQPVGYGVRSLHHRAGEPDDGMVAIPLPGRGRYRVSALAPPDLATAGGEGVAHGFEGSVRPRLSHLQAVLDRLAPEPTTASTLRWSSVFRISHRLVERYGVGRVFLAGDAAHIHPPTGAQGMNTGVQDAINLGWKLALAVAGVAAPDLTASYDAERRPVGEEVVGRTVRHAREGIDADPDDRSTILRREAQLLVGYRDSPLVGESGERTAAVRAGDRAPDARGLRREPVTDALRLHAVLAGTDHALICYVDRTAQLDRVAAARDAVARAPLSVHVLVVLSAALDVDPMTVGGACLVDAAGGFAAAYGARGGDAVLVRPDGYVGLVARPVTADAVRDALARLVRTPEVTVPEARPASGVPQPA